MLHDLDTIMLKFTQSNAGFTMMINVSKKTPGTGMITDVIASSL